MLTDVSTRVRQTPFDFNYVHAALKVMLAQFSIVCVCLPLFPPRVDLPRYPSSKLNTGMAAKLARAS